MPDSGGIYWKLEGGFAKVFMVVCNLLFWSACVQENRKQKMQWSFEEGCQRVNSQVWLLSFVAYMMIQGKGREQQMLSIHSATEE